MPQPRPRRAARATQADKGVSHPASVPLLLNHLPLQYKAVEETKKVIDLGIVRFRNGYSKDAPEMDVEFLGLRRYGRGKEAYDAIRLGRS